MHKTTVTLFGLSLLRCSGCGTILSRSGDRPVGAYPYQAVAVDVRILRESSPESRHVDDAIGWTGVTIADALIDTVLLPVDLVFWLFGVHKDGFHM